jgi:hypothetical protein
MTVKVTDIDGAVDTYTGEAELETEDITNNLVIESETEYVVYNSDRWHKAVKTNAAG